MACVIPLSPPSASRLRRARAKAVKQKMFMVSSPGGGGNFNLEDQLGFLTRVVLDISVRLSNASVYVPVWTETIWAEPGTPEWHSKADICESVLATNPADYVSLASVVEVGAGKGDDFTKRLCGGCWEVLPNICHCGAARMCGHCAKTNVGEVADELVGTLAEPDRCKADDAEHARG